MTLPDIRQQNDLKCCYHCRYNFIDYDGDDYCGLGGFGRDKLRDTCPTSVCDAFEMERE
jgi:hypothetical protein